MRENGLVDAFRFLDDLPVTGEEACPYLPDQQASYRAFSSGSMAPAAYHELMNRRFRRSGESFYEPVCRLCEACQPIRVPVRTFAPTRSQRRVWRRNQDLVVTVQTAEYTGEKFALYRRYAAEWHGKAEVSEGDFKAFLVESPVATVEFLYRDGEGRLVAAGVCDVCRASLSSVYFYFDPDSTKRSLGTYGAMAEIAWARERGIPYYYLGYWVEGSAAMAYKSRFGPHELLVDGVWVSKTGE